MPIRASVFWKSLLWICTIGLLGCTVPACGTAVRWTQRNVVPATDGGPEGGPSRPAMAVNGNDDAADGVEDLARWRFLASAPEREMVARTEVVKVIIDMADGWKTYFLQSRKWEIHYFFASRFLNLPNHPVPDHGTFNISEYRRSDRRFILGTVTHYRDQDEYTYEFVASDVLDVERTARAFKLVQSRVYFGDRLKYRPVPPTHETPEALAQFRSLNVPLLLTNEIFANVRYQPLNPGTAYGYLKFVRGEPTPATVRRYDIVVLDKVPLDIPVCSGIVTSELQTPLAHVAVLASNRGTPDMALRGAMDDARLKALEGKLVRLHVTPQDFEIREATQAEANQAWEDLRPKEDFQPPTNFTRTQLTSIAELHVSDVPFAGAKAAQLGELAHVNASLVAVPRAFVLPFVYYRDHLARNGLTAEMAAMMNAEDFKNDASVRESRLTAFRQHVEQSPIDPTVVSRVKERIRAMFPGRRVRLRSSTNAEDLVGFNGAGLYKSVVIPANPTDEQIANGLRVVWASVWSFGGFEERSFFRVDQTHVAMAILVQESIDDDVVDGVAITANPYNEGRPGLFINAQVAGGDGSSVTAARGDDVPEQILYYTYGEEREFERLSRSSRTQGAPVLTDSEVYQLSLSLRAIHLHFNSGVGAVQGAPPVAGEQAMDVEFLLSGPTRRLMIVQARPFSVRYDEGRGWAMPPP